MTTVLIVDDDPDLVRALTEILEWEGHRVIAAEDGCEGLERIYEGTPDVVLLDLEMPKLDGAGMLRQVEERGLALDRHRVILMSGSTQLALVATALGAHRFLRKPFAVEQLLELVGEQSGR